MECLHKTRFHGLLSCQLTSSKRRIIWKCKSGMKFSNSTLVFLLKACTNLAYQHQVKQVHACIVQCGLELDLFIASILIDIYARHGCIENADTVFKKTYDRDVVVWNAMIAGYTRQGFGEEALTLFHQMQQEGIRPNNVTFLSILKACANPIALEEGRKIHVLIIGSSFDCLLFVQSTLLDMYAKCNSVRDAYQVFNEMLVHDTVSWNAMIRGYTDHWLVKEALALFKQMRHEGLRPNNFTIVSVLNACARGVMLKEGKTVHAQIIKSEVELDLLVLNALVDMYAKCGCLEDAYRIFLNLHEKDVVLWNVMLVGLSDQGLYEETITLFVQMQQEGIEPDNVTLASVLKACSTMKTLEFGKHVHACIIRSDFESDVSVGNMLIDMYAKCQSIEGACIVYNCMKKQNVVTWNSMIAAYSHHGMDNQAYTLFEKMCQEHMKVDTYTFASAVKACAKSFSLMRGQNVHAQVVKGGCEADVVVGSSLVEMYARYGRMKEACQVFDKLPYADVVSWNSLIAGYTKLGMCKEVITLFEQMQEAGLKPDKVTCLSIIKLCAKMVDLEQGKQSHALVIKYGFQSDAFMANTLIDMYSKCGSIDKAHEIFDNTCDRDVASWNVMIAGYAGQGLNEEAFLLFKKMQQEGAEPDRVTFISILQTCNKAASLERGRLIHAHIRKHDFEPDISVWNTLIDLYSKCGVIDDACNVFDKMDERDLVSWNAIIAGYAQQGRGTEALTLFEKMQLRGIKPDEISFSSVLTACSHDGLMTEGLYQFYSICKNYGLMPTIEHYACIVDILGRAGRLSEAEEFINKMPLQPNAFVWLALLGSCRVHGNVDLGARAFAGMTRFERRKASAYVLMLKICRWDEFAGTCREHDENGTCTQLSGVQ